MVLKPKAYLPVPNKDLLSWMFDEQTYDQDRPILVDALDTSRTISSRQAQELIRKVALYVHGTGVRGF